jgi:peptidoglycan-N-acetylmuramic acid deacetylase
MLLHATSKDNSNILDEVIKEIKNQGYEFKNIDEFAK